MNSIKVIPTINVISTHKSIDGAICQRILPPRLDFSKIVDDQSLRTEDLSEEDETINWKVKEDAEQQLKTKYL